MKYISDVELMTRLEKNFGPVKVDLLNNIKRIVDEMPGVTPEAVENTCKQIAAVVPDLTQSIISALPDIISNFDLCASCEYIKRNNDQIHGNECYVTHEMIEDRMSCKCGFSKVVTGHWDDYNFCPKCGRKAKKRNEPCPCFTCGCYSYQSGCQMDLCEIYNNWKDRNN